MILKDNASALAHAKINLSLDITAKMPDGYHALRTVMQTVSLADKITVSRSVLKERGTAAKHGATAERGTAAEDKNRITVKSGLPYVPDDRRNIAAVAADVFLKHTGITETALDIQINKQIPVCAGLGGGSADAACVLRMLDEMFGTDLGYEQLEKLGAEIGSDVPFCIRGGTQLAEGRGEILSILPGVPHSYILICKPPFSCSTPELFGRVVCGKIRERPDTEGLLKAIYAQDIGAIARRMYNVFENILPKGREKVEAIKDIMIESGATGAAMSGSGPSVFGLFTSKTPAQNAQALIAENRLGACFLTETQPSSSFGSRDSQVLP